MNLKKRTKAAAISLANKLAEDRQVMKFSDLNNFLESQCLHRYGNHKGLTVMLSGAVKTESKAGRVDSARNIKYAFVNANLKYAWAKKAKG
ncbi:MAG: hypothetical protein ACJAS1_002411 [Oleiphilaceae bacterium]|jgi:hypothetical protein